MKLTQSAYCPGSPLKKVCISCSSEAQAIYKSVLKEIISSARGGFGNDVMSLESDKSAWEYRKRNPDNGEYLEMVCVHDHPDGCG